MESTKRKVEKFSKLHPTTKKILIDYMQVEDDKINKEIEKDQQIIVDSVDKMMFFDIENLKKPFQADFKYKLETLNDDNSDFMTLKSALNLNQASFYFYGLTNCGKINTLRIYRVSPNSNAETSSSDSNSSQILLLHGTKAPNVEGILKTGFKPSEKGKYGPGVYLTNSFDYAYRFANCVAQENGIIKRLRYIFVNEINRADVTVSPGNCKKIVSFDEYLKKKPSVIVVDGYRRVNFSESPKDKQDSLNRKIEQGSFRKNYLHQKIVLAHDSLVTPAYLIEIQEKIDIEEIVHETLYSNLKIRKFTATKKTYRSKKLKVSEFKEENKSNVVKQHTKELFVKELQKELALNEEAKLRHLQKQLDKNISSLIQQLSLDYSTIFEKKRLARYNTELLNDHDNDYKIVLRFMKSSSSHKIHQVYKVNHVEKNKESLFKDKNIVIRGCESTKVRDVLTYGCFDKKNDPNPLQKRSNDGLSTLEIEIFSSTSYCVVQNVAKKFSFVFLMASEKLRLKARVKKYNKGENTEIVTDSRGTSFGSLKSVGDRYSLDVIPAYLVVFDSD